MLVKLYGHDQENERRYSPATCIGAVPAVITGRPDPEHISTSYVERQNWTVRTSMRRYTRLSNDFSRKIEKHMAAVAINYSHTTSLRFTGRCACPRQWPQASPIACSMWPISSRSSSYQSLKKRRSR
jgi:hypothetical protein